MIFVICNPLKVSAAASVVSQALADLLQHVRQYTSRGEPIGRYDQATDTIMTVTESIFISMGDAGESKRVFFCFLVLLIIYLLFLIKRRLQGNFPFVRIIKIYSILLV